MVKPSVRNLPVTSSGGKVVEMKYKVGENKIFSREYIKETGTEVSKSLGKKGIIGTMYINMKYDNNIWRRSKGTDLGKNAIIHEASDSHSMIGALENGVTEFRIVIIKSGKKVGGYSMYNDCLYDCLIYWIKNDMHIPDELSSPEKLKKYLKLERNALIPIDDLEKIQKLIPRYNISCTGSHIYTSTNKAHKRITLRLMNGHYQNVFGPPLGKFFYSSLEKKPLFYKYDSDDNVLYYKGTTLRTLEKKDLNTFFRRYGDEYNFTLVKKGDIVAEYDTFVEMADALKTASHGLINLYKTYNIPGTAICLFNHFAQCIIPDHIEQDEAKFIDSASSGPLMYSEPYEGEAYKYDIISHYPSIMEDSHMLFPIKRGEFTHFDEETFQGLKFYQTGLYMCNVSGHHKLFRNRETNMYTNTDLRYMKQLGINFTIDETTKPNALIYSRDKCIEGNQLFKSYISMLREMKEKKIPGAKSLLNTLWGALCGKARIKITFTDDGQNVNIDDDWTIVEMGPVSENKYRINYVENETYFKTNFARMKPFLLAKGRFTIINMMLPYTDAIKRVHTDGFISSRKVKLQSSDTFGSLKYEGYCPNAKITNMRKATGEFK